MGNWARQMPGYISHETVNENVSVWTVLVNLGPFQRPVVVDVDVTRWSPPSDVFFKIKGRVEPFRGGGRFHTEPRDACTTITLQFEAEATGPMAIMLTGLARPVLERVANEFTSNLNAALNGSNGESLSVPRTVTMMQTVAKRSWFQRLTAWWRGQRSSDGVEKRS
jgi:carbon monoxide dehydrogenase subunit G